MNPTIYNIDYSLVIERILPPVKRQPITLAYLTALIKPVQDLHDDIFTNYRPDVIFRTRYNSQTIVLEGILNSVFDVQSTDKIYIDNTDNNLDIVYFYNSTEGYPPVFISKNTADGDPLYFFNEGEYQVPYDFIVYVPLTWENTNGDTLHYADYLQRIIDEIEKYKIMGVIYSVVSY